MPWRKISLALGVAGVSWLIYHFYGLISLGVVVAVSVVMFFLSQYLFRDKPDAGTESDAPTASPTPKAPPVVSGLRKRKHSWGVGEVLVLLAFLLISVGGITLTYLYGPSDDTAWVSLLWKTVLTLVILGVGIGLLTWLVRNKPWRAVGVQKKIFRGLVWIMVVVGVIVGGYLGLGYLVERHNRETAQELAANKAAKATADSALARAARESESLPYPDSGETRKTITISVSDTLSKLYVVPAGCNFNLNKLNQGAWIKIVTPNGVYDDRPGYDLTPMERITSFRLQSMSGETEVELTTVVLDSRKCRESQNSASQTG